MSRLLLVPLLLATVAAATPRRDAAPPSAYRVHAAWGGRWRGVLRYRDYQDSTRFVTLPTDMDATLAADSSSVTLAYTYDDGPGKTVRSTDRFALAAAGDALTWGATDEAPTRYAVSALDEDGAIRIVAEREGRDDNRPARLRETIRLSRDSVTIVKDVRFSADAAWLFRHEYRLARRP